MLPENTIYLIVVLQIIAGLSYNYQTLRGRTKPNRMSWLLWGVFGMVAFFASRSAGAGNEAYFTLLTGINPIITFIITFVNKESYWKIVKRDYILGALAVAGIALWAITGDGLLALAFAVIADFLAGLPTLIKAYQHPETESGIAFGICSFNAMLTLLIIDNFVVASFAFPLYIMFFCGAMFTFVIVLPRIRQK